MVGGAAANRRAATRRRRIPLVAAMSHGPHKFLGIEGRADGKFDRHCVGWGGHNGYCARWDAVGYDICNACILNEDGVCYS